MIFAKRITFCYALFVCILFAFLPSSLKAQSPENINYQAVARNATGQLIANQTVDIRVGLLSSNASGVLQYQEEFSVLTTPYGGFNIQIGSGAQTGNGILISFSDINWGESSYFLKIELRSSGGVYEDMGTTQMLSVPYALYAKSSGSGDLDSLNERITSAGIVGDSIIIVERDSTFYIDLSAYKSNASLDNDSTNELVDSLTLVNGILSVYQQGVVRANIGLDTLGDYKRSLLQDQITLNTDSINILQDSLVSFDTRIRLNETSIGNESTLRQTSDANLSTRIVADSSRLQNHLLADLDTDTLNERITSAKLVGDSIIIVENDSTFYIDLTRYSGLIDNDNDSTNELVDSLKLTNGVLELYQQGLMTGSISLDTLGDFKRSILQTQITSNTNLSAQNRDSLRIALDSIGGHYLSDLDLDSLNERITSAKLVGDSIIIVENDSTFYIDLTRYSGLIDNDNDSTNELVDSLKLTNGVLELYQQGLMTGSISLDTLGDFKRSILQTQITSNTNLSAQNRDSLRIALDSIGGHYLSDLDLDSLNERITSAKLVGDSIIIVENDSTFYIDLTRYSGFINNDNDSTNELVDSLRLTNGVLELYEQGLMTGSIALDTLGDFKRSILQTQITSNTNLSAQNRDSLRIALDSIGGHYLSDLDLDSLNERITSAKLVGDSIIIVENDSTFYIDLTRYGGLINNDNDSTNELVDSLRLTNGVLELYEQGLMTGSISLDTLGNYQRSLLQNSIALNTDSIDILQDSVFNYNTRIGNNQTAITNHLSADFDTDTMNERITSARLIGDSIVIIENDSTFYVDLSRYQALINNDNDSTNELVDSLRLTNGVLELYQQGLMTGSISLDTLGDYKRSLMQNEIALNTDSINILQDSVASYNTRLLTNQTAITNHLSADFDTDTMNERITSARLMGDSIEIIENDSTFYVDLSKYNAAINNDNDSTNELVDSLRLTNGVLELYEQGLMTGSISLDTLGDYKRGLIQNQVTSNSFAITNHLAADFDTDTMNERITSARLMGDSIEIIENDSTFYVDLSKYNAAINNDNDSTNELVDSLRLTNGVLELYEQGLMTGSISLDTLGDYKRGLIQNQVTSNSFAITNHLAADFDTDTMNERITSARLMGDSIEIIENDSTFYVDLSKYNAAINNDNDSTNELVDSLRLINGVLELYEQGLMTGSISLDTLGDYNRSILQAQVTANALGLSNHLAADFDTDTMNERITSARLMGDSIEIIENDSTFYVDLSKYNAAINNDNDSTNELVDSLRLTNGVLELYEQGLMTGSIALDTLGDYKRGLMQNQITLNTDSINILQDSVASYNTRLLTNQTAITNHLSADFDTDTMNERITSARLMGDSIEIIENDSTFYVDLSKYNAAINNDNDSTNELVDSLRLTNGVLELYEQGLMTGSIALDTLGDYKRGIIQNEIALNTDSIDVLQDSVASYNTRLLTNQTAITNHLSADFDTDTMNERITSARLMGDSIEIIENDSTFYVDLSKYNAAINNDNDSTNELVDSLRLTNGVLELYEQGLMTGSIALDTLGDYKRSLMQNEITFNTDSIDILQDSVFNYNTRIGNNQTAITNHLAADFDTDTMNERITSARLMGDSIEIIENDSTFYVDLSKYNAAINNDNDSTNELVDSLRLTNGVLELYEQGLMTGSIALDTLGDYKRSLMQNEITFNTDSIDILQDSVASYNTRLLTNQTAITNHLVADFDTDTMNERITSARLMGDSIEIIENDSTFYVDLSKYNAAINNDNDSTNELVDSLRLTNGVLELYEQGLMTGSISLDTLGDYNRSILQVQVTANALGLSNHLAADFDTDTMNERITSARLMGDSIEIIENDSTFYVDLSKYNAAINNDNDSTNELVDSLRLTNGVLELYEQGLMTGSIALDTLGDYKRSLMQNEIALNTDSINILQDSVASYNTRLLTNQTAITNHLSADFDTDTMNERITSARLMGDSIEIIENDSTFYVDLSKYNAAINNDNDSTNELVDSLRLTNGVLELYEQGLMTGSISLDTLGNYQRSLLQNSIALNTDSINTVVSNLADTSSLLRGLIIANVSTDDQIIGFNAAKDSIVLEDGGRIYIGDIRDSLVDHNSRINTNVVAIKGNTTAVGNLTTRLVNDSTSLRTITGNLAARIANDSSLTVQNRDSINSVVSNLSDTAAVLRGLIPASSTDDQVLSISAGKGKITLEDGGTIVLNDSSATNELQTISKSLGTVTLSNGGGTFVDSALTETQVDAFVANNGYLTGADSLVLANKMKADSLVQAGRINTNVTDISNNLDSITAVHGNIADTSAVLRGLIGSAGDNLGNHTASQNINLGTNKLVGNGGSQGLEISNTGNVGIGVSPNSNATLYVESTEDKAAYFEQNGTDPVKVAVFGEVSGPGTSAFALEGDANSTATSNYGLHAVSRGAGSGTNYGVYGKAIGGSINWAGYFDEGNVYIKNKVGIGTFTLDSTLTVNGGIMANSIRLSNGAGNNKVLTSDINGNARWEDVSALFSNDNLGNHQLDSNLKTGNFYISGDGDDEGLFVANDGTVGIGTNLKIDDESLTINSLNQTWGILTTTGEVEMGFWMFNNNGPTPGAGQVGTRSNHRLDFITNNQAPSMSLTLDGKLGIGISNPISKLAVFESSGVAYIGVEGTGNGNDYSGIALVDGNGTRKTWTMSQRAAPGEENGLLFAFGQGTSFKQIMYLDSTGQVGIGMVPTNADSLFTVAGGVNVENLRISEGNPTNGKVLTAVDTDGNAEWQTPSTGTDSQQLTVSADGDTLYLDNSTSVYLPDSSNTNELQTISKSGSIVTLSDFGGSFIDSALTETQVDAFVANNGYLTGADSLVFVNKMKADSLVQAGRINTNVTDISNNLDSITAVHGNIADTAAVLRGLIPAASTDDQTLSISAGKGKITLEDGGSIVLNDSSATNELQYLSINGTNDSLLLSDGNGVRLSDITSGITDNQNLSITTDSIKIQNGQGAYIGDIRDTLGAHNTRINTNLNSIKTNASAIGNETTARTTADGNLSTRITNDSTSLRTIASNLAVRIANDSSLTVQNRDSINSVVSNLSDTAAVLRGLIPAASTDDQALSISTGKGKITLEDGGTIVLNDSSATNELQTISKSLGTVTLSNGGGTFVDSALTSTQVLGFVAADGYLKTEVDGSVTNELQNLSINGTNDSLLLSNGNGVRLSDIQSGDSLWNHRATENIKLFGNYLSNDGDNEGILINNTGQVGIGTNANSSYALNVEGETRFHLPGDGDRILIDAIDNGGITIKKGAQNWSAELFLLGASYQSALELKTVGGELKFYSPGLTGPDTSFIQTSGALLFKNNGIQSLIATKEGKIGIGNSLTPDSLLTVNGGIMANSIRLTEGAGTNKVLTSFDATGAAKWEDISNLFTSDTSNIISDNDGDTKIMVEATTDDDVIRFYQEGTEFIRMDSGRIELLNRTNLVAIGENAGKNYTGSGDGSTFIGAFSGESNINGESNTGVGANTLQLTTSSYNTAVGFNVLSRNTTGVDNVGMGDYSLEYATTADGNSAFGSAALENTTTGNNNTAMGRYALRDNTTGTRNVGLGAYALVTNKTGSDNVAIGEQAMQNHESGDANTAIGGQSLYQNNGGNNNIAIGWGAGYINSTGNNNTIIGYEGLYLNSTGSANTAIGYQAGYNNTTDTGNVFLGYKAGWNATSSNKLYIENTASSTPLIYGDFERDSVVINSKLNVGGNYTFPTSSGTANQILKYNAAGNGLEWGTILGADNLGNHTATQNIKLDGKYLSGDGDNEGIHVATNGNVTIGSNKGFSQFGIWQETDKAELSIFSETKSSTLSMGASGAGESNVIRAFKFRGDWPSFSSVVSGDDILRIEIAAHNGSGSSPSDAMNISVDGVNSGNIATRIDFSTVNLTGANNKRLSITNTGNVGIGTTNPDSILTVSGGIKADAIRLTDGAIAGRVLVSTADGTGVWTAPSLFGDNLGNHTATQNLNLGAFQLVGNGGSSGIYINSSGQVGMGTTSPGGAFEVNDNSSNYTATFINTTLTSVTTGVRAIARGVGSGGNTGLYASASGATGSNHAAVLDSGYVYVRDSLGIGIFNPTSALDVKGRAKVDTLEVDGFYTLPSALGGTNEVLINDGSGNVTWSAVPAETCPSGTVAAGPKMCIETAERGATTWFTAALTCTGLGRKLPTWGEWYAGVSLGTGLANTTDDWEWVDGGTSNTVRKVGNGGIQNTANDTPTNSVDVTFRCVYYR